MIKLILMSDLVSTSSFRIELFDSELSQYLGTMLALPKWLKLGPMVREIR